MTSSFSAAVKLADLDDFLSPAQSCILPLLDATSRNRNVADRPNDTNVGSVTPSVDGVAGSSLSASVYHTSRHGRSRKIERYAKKRGSVIPSRSSKVAAAPTSTVARHNGNHICKEGAAAAEIASEGQNVFANSKSTSSDVFLSATAPNSTKVRVASLIEGLHSQVSVVRPSLIRPGPSRYVKKDASRSKLQISLSSQEAASAKSSNAPYQGSALSSSLTPSSFNASTTPSVDISYGRYGERRSVAAGATATPAVDNNKEDKQVARVALYDCLACKGCVTSSEALLVERHSVDEFLRRTGYVANRCCAPTREKKVNTLSEHAPRRAAAVIPSSSTPSETTVSAAAAAASGRGIDLSDAFSERNAHPIVDVAATGDIAAAGDHASPADNITDASKVAVSANISGTKNEASGVVSGIEASAAASSYDRSTITERPRLVVVSISPQSLSALAHYFRMHSAAITLRKLSTLFRLAGATHVLHTAAGDALSVLEVEREFIARCRKAGIGTKHTLIKKKRDEEGGPVAVTSNEIVAAASVSATTETQTREDEKEGFTVADAAAKRARQVATQASASNRGNEGSQEAPCVSSATRQQQEQQRPVVPVEQQQLQVEQQQQQRREDTLEKQEQVVEKQQRQQQSRYVLTHEQGVHSNTQHQGSDLPQEQDKRGKYTSVSSCVSKRVADNSSAFLPLLASFCPGFVCYAETSYDAPLLLQHMSRVRSGQQIQGLLVKGLLLELYNAAAFFLRYAAISGVSPKIGVSPLLLRALLQKSTYASRTYRKNGHHAEFFGGIPAATGGREEAGEHDDALSYRRKQADQRTDTSSLSDFTGPSFVASNFVRDNTSSSPICMGDGVQAADGRFIRKDSKKNEKVEGHVGAAQHVLSEPPAAALSQEVLGSKRSTANEVEKRGTDISIPSIERSNMRCRSSLDGACLQQAEDVRPHEVFHVCVMPCFDKKLEAARPEFMHPTAVTNIYATGGVSPLLNGSATGRETASQLSGAQSTREEGKKALSSVTIATTATGEPARPEKPKTSLAPNDSNRFGGERNNNSSSSIVADDIAAPDVDLVLATKEVLVLLQRMNLKFENLPESRVNSLFDDLLPLHNRSYTRVNHCNKGMATTIATLDLLDVARPSHDTVQCPASSDSRKSNTGDVFTTASNSSDVLREEPEDSSTCVSGPILSCPRSVLRSLWRHIHAAGISSLNKGGWWSSRHKKAVEEAPTSTSAGNLNATLERPSVSTDASVLQIKTEMKMWPVNPHTGKVVDSVSSTTIQDTFSNSPTSLLGSTECSVPASRRTSLSATTDSLICSSVKSSNSSGGSSGVSTNSTNGGKIERENTDTNRIDNRPPFSSHGNNSGESSDVSHEYIGNNAFSARCPTGHETNFLRRAMAAIAQHHYNHLNVTSQQRQEYGRNSDTCTCRSVRLCENRRHSIFLGKHVSASDRSVVPEPAGCASIPATSASEFANRRTAVYQPSCGEPGAPALAITADSERPARGMLPRTSCCSPEFVSSRYSLSGSERESSSCSRCSTAHAGAGGHCCCNDIAAAAACDCYISSEQMCGSGGYAERLFRRAAEELFDVRIDGPVVFQKRRGGSEGFKEAVLVVNGEEKMRVALAYGFKNIQYVIQRLKRQQQHSVMPLSTATVSDAAISSAANEDAAAGVTTALSSNLVTDHKTEITDAGAGVGLDNGHEQRDDNQADLEQHRGSPLTEQQQPTQRGRRALRPLPLFIEFAACPGGCLGGGGQKLEDRTNNASDTSSVTATASGGPLLPSAAVSIVKGEESCQEQVHKGSLQKSVVQEGESTYHGESTVVHEASALKPGTTSASGKTVTVVSAASGTAAASSSAYTTSHVDGGPPGESGFSDSSRQSQSLAALSELFHRFHAYREPLQRLDVQLCYLYLLTYAEQHAENAKLRQLPGMEKTGESPQVRQQEQEQQQVQSSRQGDEQPERMLQHEEYMGQRTHVQQLQQQHIDVRAQKQQLPQEVAVGQAQRWDQQKGQMQESEERGRPGGEVCHDDNGEVTRKTGTSLRERHRESISGLAQKKRSAVRREPSKAEKDFISDYSCTHLGDEKHSGDVLHDSSPHIQFKGGERAATERKVAGTVGIDLAVALFPRPAKGILASTKAATENEARRATDTSSEASALLSQWWDAFGENMAAVRLLRTRFRDMWSKDTIAPQQLQSGGEATEDSSFSWPTHHRAVGAKRSLHW